MMLIPFYIIHYDDTFVKAFVIFISGFESFYFIF